MERKRGAVQDVLAFLYDMRLEVKPDTLRAASRLEIGSLLTLSADFLIKTLSVETVVNSWAVAESISGPR